MLSSYNGLTDKYLTGYFNNARIRRHLVKVGLITRNGIIVPDKDNKLKFMRECRQRHSREFLIQPIFDELLDIEESKFHEAPAQSNVLIKMVFCHKSVNHSPKDIDLRHEVKVFQQHCEGENICVYKGKLREGEFFQFISRRSRGFPFGLTFYLNGLQVEHLNSCCEFRHQKGSEPKGRDRHFSFVSMDGASPCYKCVLAFGLYKKSIREPNQSSIQPDSSQKQVGGDSMDSEETDTLSEEREDKHKDESETDYMNTDDERGDTESSPSGNEISSSLSNGSSYSHKETSVSSDSEDEQDDLIIDKRTPTPSPRSSSFSSYSSSTDSEEESLRLQGSAFERPNLEESMSNMETNTAKSTSSKDSETSPVEHSEQTKLEKDFEADDKSARDDGEDVSSLSDESSYSHKDTSVYSDSEGEEDKTDFEADDKATADEKDTECSPTETEGSCSSNEGSYSQKETTVFSNSESEEDKTTEERIPSSSPRSDSSAHSFTKDSEEEGFRLQDSPSERLSLEGYNSDTEANAAGSTQKEDAETTETIHEEHVEEAELGGVEKRISSCSQRNDSSHSSSKDSEDEGHSLLSAYNSLTDKHLAGYFSNTRIRRHLVKVGLITRSGSIVPDKEYKYNVMRKYHERHMRECLAQAIFNKVLDIERHHHIQIKKKLEDFAQRERVNKIKVERSRRYNGDIIPLRSPRPPSGPRNGHTWHSGPEVEPSESSESPGSSRPNTAPEKIQRPIRLQPINSGSTHRPSQSSSPRTSSGDKERLGSTVLERDPVRHVATGKYSSGISPYCLPVINNFVTPVPPSSKRKARSFKSTPNGTMRGRKLRPTTAPSIPAVTKESKFHKMSTHSSASVTMVLHCKSLRISHNDIDLRHEVKVFQQHCGGENICVYKGKLREGEPFRFISRRHRGFPFSLTFYLNGLQVERLSSCCEFRHRRGFRLGGKRGHFSFVSVDGASPCYKCIIAMGLDKKPTPPPIGRQQDTEGEGFLGNSLEMTEDSRDKEKENVKEDSQCNMQAESSQGHDSNHRDSEEKDSIQDKEEDKAKDGYDEDFEADDERVDDERDESEPHAMNKETSSPSNEGRDFQSESKEDREIDNQESEDNEKDIYTDSEAEEDDKINNNNEDSESEAEEMKEAMPDRASSSISKVEWTEDDKTGQDVEEHIQLEHSEDDPRQGRLKELKASEEPMKAASTDNDEATSDANVKTTPTVEAVGLEPLDSALDRASLEGSLSNMQTGMTGGVARDDTEASTRETVEDVEPEREVLTKTPQKVRDSLLNIREFPQLPCTKIKVTDEQPVGAEGEAPVKDIEDEMNANFVENQKVEDTTELPQEAQEPGFETEDEKMEETSTKTELQEQKTLRMVLENSEEVLQESENNVKENKMEMAATETGENQTDESGEAHAEGTDYNFMAMCEGKAEENENNDNAEDNETRGEGTEDGGDLSAAEVAVSNMYDDEAKAEDEWTAVEANKTEEGDTDASEYNESNGREKGEILEHTTEGDTEETNEKNDTIGQSDELTEAELEAPTEEERNLDKLSTLEDGSGHTEQEENHDTIQQDKAQTGEEDDDFNIKKTSAQENQTKVIAEQKIYKARTLKAMNRKKSKKQK
ncbi:hypothetical protein Z043_100772, partial [Scleropages formosus]